MTGPDDPPILRRFSSRPARLSHVFLKDRLQNAREYRRIAGYFRSSIFELVGEEIAEVARVEEEFRYLWERGVPLPDAIVEEVGRCARKREVGLEELTPGEVAAAALVEAPLYRRGEQLMPWQRAFVGLFLEHRERFGRS